MIFLIPSQRLLITINYDIMYFPIIYDSYIILLFLLKLPITVKTNLCNINRVSFIYESVNQLFTAFELFWFML